MCRVHKLWFIVWHVLIFWEVNHKRICFSAYIKEIFIFLPPSILDKTSPVPLISGTTGFIILNIINESAFAWCPSCANLGSHLFSSPRAHSLLCLLDIITLQTCRGHPSCYVWWVWPNLYNTTWLSCIDCSSTRTRGENRMRLSS